jgi:hypothetical protein
MDPVTGQYFVFARRLREMLDAEAAPDPPPAERS